MMFDKDFQKKFDAADYINPFSSKFRYPTEFDIPTTDEVKLAVKHTQSTINFVLKKIGAPETDQIYIFQEGIE